MSQFKGYLQRIEDNQKYAYSLIRIFLGAALFVRGVILIANPDKIYVLDVKAEMHMFYSYVTIIHLLGGFLMALGFFTRIGALLQIPILFSAVFIIHAGSGLVGSGQSLELAALVLFLLIVYAVFGSGPLALSSYFKLNC
ncbi:MAG TPA: DoxX family protein [Chitinophagales bacterium]|nr:DoxX family protein [Chitinophagales bacterium]